MRICHVRKRPNQRYGYVGSCSAYHKTGSCGHVLAAGSNDGNLEVRDQLQHLLPSCPQGSPKRRVSQGVRSPTTSAIAVALSRSLGVDALPRPVPGPGLYRRPFGGTTYRGLISLGVLTAATGRRANEFIRGQVVNVVQAAAQTESDTGVRFTVQYYGQHADGSKIPDGTLTETELRTGNALLVAAQRAGGYEEEPISSSNSTYLPVLSQRAKSASDAAVKFAAAAETAELFSAWGALMEISKCLGGPNAASHSHDWPGPDVSAAIDPEVAVVLLLQGEKLRGRLSKLAEDTRHVMHPLAALCDLVRGDLPSQDCEITLRMAADFLHERPQSAAAIEDVLVRLQEATSACAEAPAFLVHLGGLLDKVSELAMEPLAPRVAAAARRVMESLSAAAAESARKRMAPSQGSWSAASAAGAKSSDDDSVYYSMSGEDDEDRLSAASAAEATNSDDESEYKSRTGGETTISAGRGAGPSNSALLSALVALIHLPHVTPFILKYGDIFSDFDAYDDNLVSFAQAAPVAV